MSMTAQQIKDFNRSIVIEELAISLYLSVRGYHDAYALWPEWKRGRRCGDKVQHERQQYFRGQAVAQLTKELPEQGVRCEFGRFGQPIHGNVFGFIAEKHEVRS